MYFAIVRLKYANAGVSVRSNTGMKRVARVIPGQLESFLHDAAWAWKT